MYLAIDYGKKRIGLALGAVLPRGAGVIDASKKREAIIFEIKENFVPPLCYFTDEAAQYLT